MIPARIGPFEGEAVGVVGFMVLGALVALVPFLDRRAARSEPSPGFTAAGIALALYLAGLTCYVWLH